MMTPAKCWICSGRGNSLCGNCNRAKQERMAKYNIDGDQAAWELRQMVIEEQVLTITPGTRTSGHDQRNQ